MSSHGKRSFWGYIESFKTYVGNLFFPASCGGCGREGTVLCNTCLSSPLATKTPAPWIRSIYRFKTPIGKALKDAKYRHYHSVLEHIARNTGTLFDEYVSHIPAPTILVIPIPQTRARTQKRGFNQSELIARYYVAGSKQPRLEFQKTVLEKTKETLPQATIRDQQKRTENVLGAFQIRQGVSIAGKTLLLIDDVTTTGATLSEARTTLLRAGAKEVYAFTIAH